MTSPHLKTPSRKRPLSLFLTFLLATAGFFGTGLPGHTQTDPAAEAFAKIAGTTIEGANTANVTGADASWFFLVRELQQMSLGQFWTQPWEQVAQNGTDPVPFIAEFNQLLKDKGIRLILAPIPAKASIYPDKLTPIAKPGDPYPLKPFFDQIRAQGVEVLDIEPVLRQRRADTGDKLYCEQDAHYSPQSILILADLLKQQVASEPWFQAVPKNSYFRTAPQQLLIAGDQVSQHPNTPKEMLDLTYVYQSDGSEEPVPQDTGSPVLLLGDSHTLVFHEGASTGMHCQGAGLVDQLQYEFGFPVDLVGVRGSGQVQARRSLIMKAKDLPDYWANKKLVIWVFSVREFTQSFDKLISIPIELP